MSYCREEGKDRIFFVTKEDYEKPSTALVTTKNDDEDDEEPGLILKDGSINWNCPCLGGMASGPCGIPFRDAFSCFHYSEADPKGSDCFESFKKMQDCMSEYPVLYPKDDDDFKDPLTNTSDKPEEKVVSESSSDPASKSDSSSEIIISHTASTEKNTVNTTS